MILLYLNGCIDVGDGCWWSNVLVTIFGCWWKPSSVCCPARSSMWAKEIQTVFQWKWFHYYEKIVSRFIIDQNRCIRYVVLWMIYVWNWCFIDFFIRSDFLRSKRSILKRQKTWWIKLQRRYCHIISQNWCLNLYFNLIRWSYTTNRC